MTATLDDTATRIAQAYTQAAQAGERPPGRRALAARLGVSEHQVRAALARAGDPGDHPGEVGDPGGRPVPPTFTHPSPTSPALPPAGENRAPTLTQSSPGRSPASPTRSPAGDRPPPTTPPTVSDQATPAARPGDTAGARPPHGWPLVVMAIAAGVVIWTGWVSLGALTGFGPTRPLPGIIDVQINTAIVLPMGIEAYGGYALRVWLSRATLARATRRYARASALGALGVGAGAQIAAHVMAAAHMTAAPLWVTVLVSCVPVLTLGLAIGLHSMVRRDTRITT